MIFGIFGGHKSFVEWLWNSCPQIYDNFRSSIDGKERRLRERLVFDSELTELHMKKKGKT